MNWIRYFLFIILGFAPFALINSIWSEVPLLVHQVPECENIGAAVAAANNIGNLSPLIYMLLTARYRISARYAVPSLLLCSALGCVFFMRWQSMRWLLAGSYRSVALLIAAYLAGVTGTLVLVLFGYLAEFEAKDTTAFSTGLGFAGVVAGLLAQVQALGADQPLWSITAFAWLTLAVVVASGAAFVCIERQRLVWTQTVSVRLVSDNEEEEEEEGRGESAVVALEDADVDVLDSVSLLRAQSTKSDAFGTRDFFRVVGPSALHVLASSVIFFFVMPGMLPFLSDDDHITTTITTVYMIGNMVGRALPSFVQFWQLWPLNVAQAVCLFILILMAMARDVFVSSWLAVPFAFILSTTNGHLNTLAFLVADQRTKMYETPSGTAQRARRWIGLCNQMGVVLGGYLAVGFVALSAFHVKQPAGNKPECLLLTSSVMPQSTS